MTELGAYADLVPKRRKQDLGGYADLVPKAPANPYADLIPDRRKAPRTQSDPVLGDDPLADLGLGGMELAKPGETAQALKETPPALLRGAVNFLQAFPDTITALAKLGEPITGEVFTVPTPQIPKPDAPETDTGKLMEMVGEFAPAFTPVGAVKNLPKALSRGAKATEVVAPEVATAARVAEKAAVKEGAIEATETATKAADALTPEALFQERALPKKVEGFSSKRYTPPEAAALEAGKGFREKRTFDEIKASAEASGMSVEDLLKTKRGAVYSSEEAFTDALTRGRMLRRQESQRITSLKDTLDPSNPEHLKAFDEMKLRFAAVSEKAAALESESGRALGSLRMEIGHERRLEKAQRNILSGQFGADPAQQIKMLQSLDDPVQVARFMRKLPTATTVDKIKEVWINGLLSGPTTHVKNFVSNSLVAAYSLPERALAVIVPVGRAGNRVYAREVLAQASGMAKAMKQATRTAWRTFIDEGAVASTGKVELSIPAAIKGPIGYVARTPGRALEASDQWFKAINYGGEIEALAVRKAIQEGKRGADIGARATELLTNPPEALVKQAWDKARVATFTNPLNEQKGLIAKSARAIQHLKIPEKITHKVPTLARPVNAALDMSSTVVFPFVRTPTNILKFSVARSLLGILMRDVQRELAAGGARAQQAWANMILGSSIAGTIGTYAYKTGNERITGAGPSDANERRTWRLSGRAPYSIKIGDKWHAYGGLEPIGTLIGIAADFAEIGNTLTTDEKAKVASLIGMAFARNVKEKTFLQGMANAIEAMDDPDRYGERFVQNLAGSAVPTILAQAARANDPVVRDVQGIMDRLKSRIPTQSEKVPALLNLWGEEIKREGSGALSMFSPVYVSTQKNDPVTEEMIRLGVSPRMPEREIADVRLTPEQYSTFVKTAGRAAKSDLDEWVRSREWKSMTDPEKVNVMETLINRHRATARQNLILDNEELFQAKVRQREGG